MKIQTRDELARTHLCATCSRGTVTRFRDGRLRSSCTLQYDGTPFEGEVSSCTSYNFTYGETPHDMEKKAFVLEVRKGRVLGFKPPTGDDD